MLELSDKTLQRVEFVFTCLNPLGTFYHINPSNNQESTGNFGQISIFSRIKAKFQGVKNTFKPATTKNDIRNTWAQKYEGNNKQEEVDIENQVKLEDENEDNNIDDQLSQEEKDKIENLLDLTVPSIDKANIEKEKDKKEVPQEIFDI